MTKIYLVKVPLNVKILQQDLLHRKQFLKILWCEVRKGDFNFCGKWSSGVLPLMLWCSLAWFPYFYSGCPWQLNSLTKSRWIVCFDDLDVMWKGCWDRIRESKEVFFSKLVKSETYHAIFISQEVQSVLFSTCTNAKDSY